MNRRFRVNVPLAMAATFASMVASAQQAGPQRYGMALYLHVAPDKDAQFVEFYKTGAGMKAARARMKADPNITAISLRRIAFANPIPRANYVILTQRNGPPVDPDPAKRDDRDVEVLRSQARLRGGDRGGPERGALAGAVEDR